MSFDSALSRILHETSAAFGSTGYAFFTIEAHIVCVIILAILFNRQQNSSDQTESWLIWSRLLFFQILYCISKIVRVLVDIDVIYRSIVTQYISASVNFMLFGCISWLVFLYTESLQKSNLVNSSTKKFMTALPFLVNVIMLVSSPLTGLYLDISGEAISHGMLFPMMFIIDLSYPVASLCLIFHRRRKMTRYERDTLSNMVLYPAFFAIAGPLQLFNARVPFMCYAMIISDILVSISYTDSLVSVDPLTKISNKNGLTRRLSERLGQEHPEKIHVFAIDIDNLNAINSHYGRPEGDKALIITAGALKKLRDEEHPCCTSRYYGDEFMLFADIENDEELELFTEHIRNYIMNAATKSGVKYPIRVNIGTSRYEQYSRTETVSGLIGEAYKSLNENREQRRFNIWNEDQSQ